MTVGSLFSGIGGFDLGLERAGMRIRWQVENNAYCNRVLAKHWPTVQRYGDIRSIDWRTVESIDLVCGGFPCQPFSCAGKRRGQEDDRYLWPEVVSCLSVLKPTWFIGENVPGLIHLGFEQVCLDLEALGYETTTIVIPACAVDAPHRRYRLWIMAYTESEQIKREGSRGFQPKLAQCGEVLANTEELRLEGRWNEPNSDRSRGSKVEFMGCGSTRNSGWSPEPNVGRVVDGVPYRVDRLRGLGNSVVPQIVEVLGEMIMHVNALEVP